MPSRSTDTTVTPSGVFCPMASVRAALPSICTTALSLKTPITVTSWARAGTERTKAARTAADEIIGPVRMVMSRDPA
jgi:hypothetical protein